MRGKNSGIVYDGWFEFGDVIRQELKGPKGEGSVIYPNGDHFEGFFHLNYAHIYGPAYAADGKYTFADGSVIEHAWINTSDDLEVMDLIGIYPVKRAIGPDTITPFYRHKINGIEIVLSEMLLSCLMYGFMEMTPKKQRWKPKLASSLILQASAVCASIASRSVVSLSLTTAKSSCSPQVRQSTFTPRLMAVKTTMVVYMKAMSIIWTSPGNPNLNRLLDEGLKLLFFGGWGVKFLYTHCKISLQLFLVVKRILLIIIRL